MSDKKNSNGMLVGELAATGGVGLGTIRHYQRLGLLPIPTKPNNGGIRTYSREHLDRLLVIKNTQAIGFSLKEIGVILRYREKSDCQSIRSLCLEKEEAIQSLIRAEKDKAKTLMKLANSCNGACGEGDCRIFQHLVTIDQK